MDGPGVQLLTDKPDQPSNSEKALITLSRIMAGGVAAILLFSLQANGFRMGLATFGIGLAVAGSTLLSGGLMGFLFAIPRTLQQEDKTAGNGNSDSISSTGNIHYAANTNLEQISDWLTKIFVGVTLTQLNKIPDGMTKAARFATQGLGPDVFYGTAFFLFLMVFFAVAGFLFAYLWTRLNLAGALREADLKSIERKLVRVVDKTLGQEARTRDNQELADMEVESLVDRLLDPHDSGPPIPQERLSKAISTASLRTRAKIFNQICKVRREIRRAQEGKPDMSKIIPVFKALIQADPDNHKIHAQLGYALKDKKDPDFEAAEKELTLAIKLRGDLEKNEHLYYELNRAICRIRMTESHREPWVSDEASKMEIIADIRELYKGGFYDKIASETYFHSWMETNKINNLEFQNQYPPSM